MTGLQDRVAVLRIVTEAEDEPRRGVDPASVRIASHTRQTHTSCGLSAAPVSFLILSLFPPCSTSHRQVNLHPGSGCDGEIVRLPHKGPSDSRATIIKLVLDSSTRSRPPASSTTGRPLDCVIRGLQIVPIPTLSSFWYLSSTQSGQPPFFDPIVILIERSPPSRLRDGGLVSPLAPHSRKQNIRHPVQSRPKLFSPATLTTTSFSHAAPTRRTARRIPPLSTDWYPL